jgi:putative colanic acid biosynthesis acetyltransferase WcaF
LEKREEVVYRDQMPFSNRLRRLIWNIMWCIGGRFSPSFFFSWRNSLLNLFGAQIGLGVHVYPSAKIWAPWNLEMGSGSSLGPGVICYSVDRIVIGPNATISQYAHLCAATHDVEDPEFHLVTKPIIIGPNAWVAADAFVGPGVIIGEGAVVGARAAVFKDVKAWTVVGGNPAKMLKTRKLRKKKS